MKKQRERDLYIAQRKPRRTLSSTMLCYAKLTLRQAPLFVHICNLTFIRYTYLLYNYIITEQNMSLSLSLSLSQE